jgi:hypothetical protein
LNAAVKLPEAGDGLIHPRKQRQRLLDRDLAPPDLLQQCCEFAAHPIEEDSVDIYLIEERFCVV